MKLPRLNYLSKPFKIPTFTLKPILTLPILETHLQKCQNIKQFNQILSQMILSGLFKDSFAASRLLKFSTELPFIHTNQSYQIFSLIENTNGFICNTMMKGYMQSNSPCKAIWVYKLMIESNVTADNYTYPILFQSCSVRLAEFDGKCIQDHVLKMSFDSDVYIQNTLINMYAIL